jgi:hypothetical protein
MRAADVMKCYVVSDHARRHWARRIERLPRPEQLLGEARTQPIGAGAVLRCNSSTPLMILPVALRLGVPGCDNAASTRAMSRRCGIHNSGGRSRPRGNSTISWGAQSSSSPLGSFVPAARALLGGLLTNAKAIGWIPIHALALSAALLWVTAYLFPREFEIPVKAASGTVATFEERFPPSGTPRQSSTRPLKSRSAYRKSRLIEEPHQGGLWGCARAASRPATLLSHESCRPKEPL